MQGEVNVAATTTLVWLLLFRLRRCSDVHLVVVVELQRLCTRAHLCRSLRLDGKVTTVAVGR